MTELAENAVFLLRLLDVLDELSITSKFLGRLFGGSMW